jgi:Protein of unknown function (DUF3761)
MSLRAVLGVALACGVFAAMAAAGRNAVPPPGATALCTDGTYSFSQTRSGTCSHHGGVAQWLTPTAAPAPAPTPAAPPTTIWNGNVGATVAISRRTRSSGCKLGPNPDRACSPGAYYSGLTTAVLCSSSFRTGDVRDVPDSEKHAVEVEYGMAPRAYGRTLEIDHIVSLELGGSNDIANLYPEKASPGPGYHVKDKLENKLHAMVCAGTVTLRAAQVGIATHWQALYVSVFGTSP